MSILTKCKHPKDRKRVHARNPIVLHNCTQGGRFLNQPAKGSILICLDCGHTWWSYASSMVSKLKDYDREKEPVYITALSLSEKQKKDRWK